MCNETIKSFSAMNGVPNHDVTVHEIDGNKIIIIRVKEAPETMKPVYLNGRSYDAYICTGDGDRKATEEELCSFLRNAHPNQDSLAAEGFTIKDLDPESIAIYKSKVSKIYPAKEYLEMNDQDFLVEIGACYIDRNSGEYKVNFYMIVYEKLKALLQEAFRLDEGQIRISTSDFDETIRECLVNCLAHADYVKGYPSIKIEVYDGWYYPTRSCAKMQLNHRYGSENCRLAK